MHKYARNNLSNIIFEEIIGFFIFFGRKGGGRPKKGVFTYFGQILSKNENIIKLFLLDVPKC